MPDSADRKKYEPLGEFLTALPMTTEEITLSFEQVAQIIQAELPQSAFLYREWWANQEGGARAPYWRAAGFKVDKVHQTGETVRFTRVPLEDDRPSALTLQEVVTGVNKRALIRSFGSLPKWRKQHKDKKSLPRTPFYSGVEVGRNYVFHVGGLSELQFNLGFEPVQGIKTFRHGVAFSLQTTRELPTIDPLRPKIVRFNEYLHIYPDAFAAFEMWHWSKGDTVRSENYPVAPIPDSQVENGFFIVIGRLQPADRIDLGLILDDFDRLLPLYEFVEGTATFPSEVPNSLRRGFVWSPGNKARVRGTVFERSAKTVETSLRHNALQSALFEHLKSLYGDSVSGEQLTSNGTYIDVAVRHGEEYEYYEIKTGLSAQSCIREALGQLLEYSYWPGAQSAVRLFIVGEPPLDKQAETYLETLRKEFEFPVEYRQFNVDLGRFI